MLRQGPFNWLKPKNDFVLKWILGSDNDQSKELLLAFLNDFCMRLRCKVLLLWK